MTEVTGARILLIDDDAFDVEMALAAFETVDPHLHVDVALGGQAAIEHLQRNLEHQDALPILILLDWKMPGMGGRDVLAWIRDQKPLAHVPVVIFSTSRESGDVKRAYQLGANAYVRKPEEFAQLEMVIRILERFWQDLNVQPGRE